MSNSLPRAPSVERNVRSPSFEVPEYHITFEEDGTLQWTQPAASKELALALSYHFPKQKNLEDKMQAAIRRFLQASKKRSSGAKIDTIVASTVGDADSKLSGTKPMDSVVPATTFSAAKATLTSTIVSNDHIVLPPLPKSISSTGSQPSGMSQVIWKADTGEEVQVKPKKRQYTERERKDVGSNRGKVCKEHQRKKQKCNPLTCPQNKQYQNIGLDMQHRTEPENSNDNNDCNTSSKGSEFFELRNSGSPQLSNSQALTELKGEMKILSSRVIQNQIREEKIKAQAPANLFGFDDVDHAQKTSEDFDEMIPSWLIDPVADMDMQSFAVTPGICEASQNAYELLDITQFDKEWWNIETMSSDMARVAEMDTSTNFKYRDSIIPEVKLADTFSVDGPNSIAPLSRALPAGWTSSSPEPASTSLTSFESIDEACHEDDRMLLSLDPDMRYVGKDTEGAREERHGAAIFHTPDEFEPVTFGKMRGWDFRRRKNSHGSRVRLPEPPETKGYNPIRLSAIADFDVSAKTVKVSESGEGVKSGIEVMSEMVLEPVSALREVLAKIQPAQTATLKEHNCGIAPRLNSTRGRPRLCLSKDGKDATKGSQDFYKRANSASKSVSKGYEGQSKPRASSMPSMGPAVSPKPVAQSIKIPDPVCIRSNNRKYDSSSSRAMRSSRESDDEPLEFTTPGYPNESSSKDALPLSPAAYYEPLAVTEPMRRMRKRKTRKLERAGDKEMDELAFSMELGFGL